jgi:hypothetical protein
VDTIQQNSVKSSMTNELFGRLSEFIYTESGIKMPLSKKTMLEARLAKRLKAINPRCYLFTGHPETLSGMNVLPEIMANTVYLF